MVAMKCAALLLLCLCASTQAKRAILQVPDYQGTGISVQNSDDPGAFQAADPTPVPDATTASDSTPQAEDVASAASLAASPVQAPDVSGVAPTSAFTQPPTTQPPSQFAQAPVQPPLVLPTPPAPVPTVVLPPVVQPPAPAQQPPVQQPPAPAPQQPVVIPQVPVPAPTLVLPPAVAAPVPVPAPAPVSTPQCGQKPQCKLFVEDMLCCENAGALTNKQHAVLRLQCTHPVNYMPSCFNLTGPSNMTAFQQFETDLWSTNHVAQVNMLEAYKGNVTVDIEKNRNDPSGMCGLFITPCLYEGNLISQVPPVDGISFTTIPTADFLEVADSIEADVDALDSLVWANPMMPSTCQQKNLGALNGTFFNTTWVNYSEGDAYQCNYTAFADALAPAPAPLSFSVPVNPTQTFG